MTSSTQIGTGCLTGCRVLALTRRPATVLAGSLRRCRSAPVPVGTKVMNNHLVIGKLHKLPRGHAAPRSEKPAVRSPVVRVVVLGRTICWQLRASRIQLAH